MLKMEKAHDYDKFPKLDISKFRIRNEEVAKKLEKKLLIMIMLVLMRKYIIK